MSDQPRPTPRTQAAWVYNWQTSVYENDARRRKLSETLERESDAREERLFQLSHEFGEHLYFLNAPSLPDGFRMAAERIKSSEERIRELERQRDEVTRGRELMEDGVMRLQEKLDVALAENAKLREELAFVDKFGDAVADMFVQLAKGNWIDELEHPVRLNVAMLKLKEVMEEVLMFRQALAGEDTPH